MGTAPTPVLVSSTGAGNSTDGQITRDSIDDLIGAMSSHLLIYLRAKKMSTIKTNFPDALGNTVTCGYVSDCTYTASDSNFNSKPSIAFNGSESSNMYTMGAGSIGIGIAPVAMTNSFTVMAGIHAGNASVNSLYGDTAGTTNQALSGVYLGASGNPTVNIGGSGGAVTLSGSLPLLAAGSTGVVWCSYDGATNIVRMGCNSTAVQLAGTATYTRNGAGTGTICYPFGYQNIGVAGNQSFNRWTLWNKAYMNGSVPADDAAFANLVAAYTASI